MAGRFGSVTVEVSAGAASAITAIQLIAAANHAVRILGFDISPAGTTNTDAPIAVQIERQTNAGTVTAGTMVKMDDSVADTLDTTAGVDATSEPTTGDVIMKTRIHPQTYKQIFFTNPELIIGESARVGIVLTAAVTVTVAVTVFFEE